MVKLVRDRFLLRNSVHIFALGVVLCSSDLDKFYRAVINSVVC